MEDLEDFEDLGDGALDGCSDTEGSLEKDGKAEGLSETEDFLLLLPLFLDFGSASFFSFVDLLLDLEDFEDLGDGALDGCSDTEGSLERDGKAEGLSETEDFLLLLLLSLLLPLFLDFRFLIWSCFA